LLAFTDCNLEYGFNGWLGIAGISIDSNGHITTGSTKPNDAYFNTTTYNDPKWKRSVACPDLLHPFPAGALHPPPSVGSVSPANESEFSVCP